MLDDLIIVNLPPDSGEAIPPAFTNLQWQTCLRRIVFLHRTELDFLASYPDVQLYQGKDAYQHLLEVICGLHSPMLGETAVMGQFRKFRANASFPVTSWGRFLSKLTTDLLVDARYIRQHYLNSLGSQSYGSLIRKQLRGVSGVALLGTGSLAQEILPWLPEEVDIRVFYRSWFHAKTIVDNYPHVQLDRFTMSDVSWKRESVALVIAAPINSAEIQKWLDIQSTSFATVIDLRDTSATDPIHLSQRLITLSQLFHMLRHEQQRLESRTFAARAEIEMLAHQSSRSQVSRGLGKLCA